jgi:hypothetical protein
VAKCRNCGALELVCENHRDKPWRAGIGCECGAGAPCPVCQPDRAAAGYLVRIIEWLEDQGEFALAKRIEWAEYRSPEERERAGEFLPPRTAWN